MNIVHVVLALLIAIIVHPAGCWGRIQIHSNNGTAAVIDVPIYAYRYALNADFVAVEKVPIAIVHANAGCRMSADSVSGRLVIVEPSALRGTPTSTPYVYKPEIKFPPYACRLSGIAASCLENNCIGVVRAYGVASYFFEFLADSWYHVEGVPWYKVPAFALYHRGFLKEVIELLMQTIPLLK